MADGLTCDDCGKEPRWCHATLLGVRSCIHCAATRALAVLDPSGPKTVTPEDVRAAARVLRWASVILPHQHAAERREKKTRLRILQAARCAPCRCEA